TNVDEFIWEDDAWLEKRKKNKNASYPCAIYEVHLGSWKKRDGHYFLNYREIAHELAAYVKEMGFTHIELMPVSEHPLDESWGYQVTGFYAVTSRFGTVQDFQYFVNHMHKNGIGVILDWVPAHFPTDDFSLAQFDGSYLFEHADPKKGFHPHWNTYIFNYGRREVSNFLICSALFWFGKMHIDGLRVDAVASMLYLDYGRNPGEWIPNEYGRNENLEAIEFLKHLNSIVHDKFPGVLMCAEESTAFTGVSHPLEWGGLGFDLKWNMGWMNDTLKYFHKDPIYRRYHQNDLTFSLIYAFTEKFISVISHDEVVHGKANLITKMPGDDWQKFANVRLLYSYMICHPGKKLLFMGTEFGQWDEWQCKSEIHWFLLQYFMHQGLQKCIKELNHFYQNHPALWQHDHDSRGFEWIDFSDHDNCVVSYLRKGDGCYLVCVHNFTPTYFSDYFIRLGNISHIHEVFNTDREEFGGSGKVNSMITIAKNDNGQPIGFITKLAPLGTMIFEVDFVF
ncbi:MAG: 1,4-alpha-glucan branching protein GlgB, partial [Chlamydiae bacterium]|nr:1,4-alpha-glucan branching protein GlgB [Chlamydiota bacterium]